MRALPALLLAACAPFSVAAADPVEGKKLVAEKKCETCHHNKTMGDAAAVSVVMFALIMAVTLIQLWFNRHA